MPLVSPDLLALPLPCCVGFAERGVEQARNVLVAVVGARLDPQAHFFRLGEGS